MSGCLHDPRLETLLRRPVEFLAHPRRVDRIAPVMAGAVGDETDQPLVRCRLGPALIEQTADQPHDVEVLPLVAATDVVGLAQAPAPDHAFDAAAVVLDVQPVADVAAVAIDRDVPALQAAADHGRDELLGVLQRTVVVRAVGGRHRQAVGVEVGAHQVIRSSLARRIRGVRRIRRAFGERRIIPAERAVDLVGGDVVEAPPARGRGARQLLLDQPVLAAGFEQGVCADDVGAHELAGAADRAIDVRFGSKVHNSVDGVLAQQACDQRGVADVTLHEGMTLLTGQFLQVVGAAGVGQRVEVDDAHPGILAEQPAHVVGTDEAGTAGDQNVAGGVAHADFHSSRMETRPARQSGTSRPSSTLARVVSSRELVGRRAGVGYSALAMASMRGTRASRPRAAAASSAALAKPCQLVCGTPAKCQVPFGRVSPARCRPASCSSASAMAAAGVGPPSWSATTRSCSRSRPSLSIVRTKLLPWAPNTQATRRIRCAQPLARMASSPASLLAP